ncbi:unnamed protein product, partial [Bubo scandiacus]
CNNNTINNNNNKNNSNNNEQRKYCNNNTINNNNNNKNNSNHNEESKIYTNTGVRGPDVQNHEPRALAPGYDIPMHASELATTWKLLSDTLEALRADRKATQQASVPLEQTPVSLAGETASSASRVSADCKNECPHCPPDCPCHQGNQKNQEADAIPKRPPPKPPR